jgi:aminoglycoside-2''-adenylyltransferase
MSAGDWERLRPEDVAELLAGFDAPWWIAGGWALDLFLDAETRPHGDVDVAVLRDWDLRYVTEDRTLAPWDEQPLRLPVHAVWARRSLDPSAPWTFEVLLNEHRGDRWVYRRDPAISLPLSELGGRREGIPLLRPEVVLLYKSKHPTLTDERDFDAVEPHLTTPARSWLREALSRSAPRHAWLQRLVAR